MLRGPIYFVNFLMSHLQEGNFFMGVTPSNTKYYFILICILPSVVKQPMVFIVCIKVPMGHKRGK